MKRQVARLVDTLLRAGKSEVHSVNHENCSRQMPAVRSGSEILDNNVHHLPCRHHPWRNTEGDIHADAFDCSVRTARPVSQLIAFYSANNKVYTSDLQRGFAGAFPVQFISGSAKRWRGETTPNQADGECKADLVHHQSSLPYVLKSTAPLTPVVTA